MELAKEQGFYDDTIFVFFGDHNTRISQIPHMAPAFEQLGLESNNVPLLIHAPKWLAPREFDAAVGLADLLPTVAGLVGVPFDNGGLGRDLQLPAPEGERVVPLVLQEGTFPVIGAVTRDFLVQMQHDGSSPTLHDLHSPTPRDNVAAQHPQIVKTLTAKALAWNKTLPASPARDKFIANGQSKGTAKPAPAKAPVQAVPSQSQLAGRQDTGASVEEVKKDEANKRANSKDEEEKEWDFKHLDHVLTQITSQQTGIGGIMAAMIYQIDQDAK
jgi:hypothetical protein